MRPAGLSRVKLFVFPPSTRAGTVNVNKPIIKMGLVVNLLEVNILNLLAICETWLTSDVPSSFVDISGYHLFRIDVAGGTSQAIIIDVSVANTLVIRVLKWDTFIIVFYRAPSYNDLENDSLRTFLSEFYSVNLICLA